MKCQQTNVYILKNQLTDTSVPGNLGHLLPLQRRRLNTIDNEPPHAKLSNDFVKRAFANEELLSCVCYTNVNQKLN